MCDDSAVIGLNLVYARIYQLSNQTGKNKSVEIPARLYLQIVDEDYKEIMCAIQKYLI